MNEQMYREEILEHYRHPLNKGTIKDPDFEHVEFNTLCGDKIHVTLNVKERIIDDVLFEGEGCAISIAASSIISEKIKGLSIQNVKNLDKDFILKELGIKISSGRIKCATLFLEAVQKALIKNEIE